VAKDLARVLRLRFGGSLRTALSTHPDVSSSVVEQVLEDALKFQRGIQGFESLLAAAKWLKLPPDIQFQVEDAINQVWTLTQSSSFVFSQTTVSFHEEGHYLVYLLRPPGSIAYVRLKSRSVKTALSPSKKRTRLR